MGHLCQGVTSWPGGRKPISSTHLPEAPASSRIAPVTSACPVGPQTKGDRRNSRCTRIFKEVVPAGKCFLFVSLGSNFHAFRKEDLRAYQRGRGWDLGKPCSMHEASSQQQPFPCLLSCSKYRGSFPERALNANVGSAVL